MHNTLPSVTGISHLPELVDLSQRLNLPELSDGLWWQVTRYISAVESINELREKPLNNGFRWLAMLEFKMAQFIFSRDLRVADTLSPEVTEALDIKNRLFVSGPPLTFLCMDSRVLSNLIACLQGRSLRTPAGDMTNEFLPKAFGPGLFLREGELTQMIDQHLAGHDIIVEMLDSHFGCAARGIDQRQKLGYDPADGGLAADVKRKRQMAEALKEFVQKRYGSAKKIFPLQFSFDPHEGYSFQGLELNLEDKRVMADGFTAKVLKQLIEEGKIVSTKALCQNEEFRKILSKKWFALDYETNYRQSKLLFWKNVDDMCAEALPMIHRALQSVFPHLNQGANRHELIQRSIFLLANAYNAFLLNTDEQGKPKAYLYDTHEESVIAVTFSEKGPFDRAVAFSIDPHNKQLSDHLTLGMQLIWNNRKSGRMSSYEIEALGRIFENSQDYVFNPVLAMFFERLPHHFDEAEIERLRKVDWSDLPTLAWWQMTDGEFLNYLDQKSPNIPAVIANAANDLRHRAIQLLTPGHPATEVLLDGRLVPVWTVSGPQRETYLMLPFLTKGF